MVTIVWWHMAHSVAAESRLPTVADDAGVSVMVTVRLRAVPAGRVVTI